MADLRALYERHGHHDVITYLQSGNVVSRASARRAAAVEESIRAVITSDLGLDVAVLVRTPAELRRVLDGNPFLRRKQAADVKALHVTFLADRPRTPLVRALDLSLIHI